MRLVAFSFCAFMIAVGAMGVLFPTRLIDFVRRFQSRQGLFLAAAIRLAFGGALFLVAPSSRAPGLVQGLGIFLIAAGLITPFFGVERFERILDWWTGRSPLFMRAWAAFALLFGLLVTYLIVPVSSGA